MRSLRRVAVDGAGRERWETYGEVLGAEWTGSAIANPLAGCHVDGLPGADIENGTGSLDAKHALQDDRELVELRGLARFYPTRRTHHASDAQGSRVGVDAAHELLNLLGLVAGSTNDGWCLDESGHGRRVPEDFGRNA